MASATSTQTIAAASVDLISICLGINAYGEGSFGPRTWPGQVSRFVQTLRDAHPIVPIAVISSIAAPDREHKSNAVCMTLSQIRRGVVDAVSVLRELGDSGIHLIDGLSLLGVADSDLLADAVHPSPDGYRVIAERIASRLNALLTPSQENGASRVLPMQRRSDQTLQ